MPTRRGPVARGHRGGRIPMTRRARTALTAGVLARGPRGHGRRASRPRASRRSSGRAGCAPSLDDVAQRGRRRRGPAQGVARAPSSSSLTTSGTRSPRTSGTSRTRPSRPATTSRTLGAPATPHGRKIAAPPGQALRRDPRRRRGRCRTARRGMSTTKEQVALQPGRRRSRRDVNEHLRHLHQGLPAPEAPRRRTQARQGVRRPARPARALSS